ncbi:hypothetical protein BZA77DRAFT_239436 [Pyronema omphalodes]|nr:hypothetical protein BZA77DRAFT_239436 [Pyronema omphalodes]
MSTTVKPRKDHPTEPIDEPPRKAARTKSKKTVKKETVKKEEDSEQVTERRDETLIWPAPPEQIEAAREFILEAAQPESNVLLVPDRDTDGLSAGTIMSLTLRILSKKPLASIHTHFVQQGRNVFTEEERKLMTTICKEKKITHMIILDQGSRRSPPLLDETQVSTKVLIIDHHHSDYFPENATMVNACNHKPIATSSLLTYVICKPLHKDIEKETAWAAILGIFGDLGATTKLVPPYPDELAVAKKTYTAKHITDLVGLLNAPRRTPECNTIDAWELLQREPYQTPEVTPKMIMKGEWKEDKLQKLRIASARIKEEVEAWTRTAPQFSRDGKVCMIYIESGFQIHGIIAIRWASHMGNENCKVVMCANGAYVKGRVNFSCRVARTRGKPTVEGQYDDVDIIKMLKEFAAKDPWLLENIGTEFANGHKHASGGSLPKEVWEVFLEKGLEMLKKGERPEKADKNKKSPKKSPQKNTMDSWLIKEPVSSK